MKSAELKLYNEAQMKVAEYLHLIGKYGTIEEAMVAWCDEGRAELFELLVKGDLKSLIQRARFLLSKILQ
jgi:hypothetical protein